MGMSRPRFNRFTEEIRHPVSGEVELHLPATFDAYMDPRDQQRFLRDPSYSDADGPRVDDFEMRLKWASRYDRLLTVPEVEQAIAVTRAYVRTCIPAFARTEKLFWNVTGWPGGRWAILRVNANWNINFDVFTDWRGGFVYRWYLWREHLASLLDGPLDALEQQATKIWDRQVRRTDHPADWMRSPMVAGGSDQVVLRVFDTEGALKLLRDPAMVRAARLFALNLARMGKTPFGRYHCFDLADRLVEAQEAHNG